MRNPRLYDEAATTRATSLAPSVFASFSSVSSSLLPPLDPRNSTTSRTAYPSQGSTLSSPFSHSPHYASSSSRQSGSALTDRAAAVSQAWQAGPPPASIVRNPPHHQLLPREHPQQRAPVEQPPKPAAPVHRVYVLNCASCKMFLSDRGMRVSTATVWCCHLVASDRRRS